MAKFRIEVDREACIGCGACSATCPKFFAVDETEAGTKARAARPEADDYECSMEAAQVCPVNAIHITDTSENKKLI